MDPTQTEPSGLNPLHLLFVFSSTLKVSFQSDLPLRLLQTVLPEAPVIRLKTRREKVVSSRPAPFVYALFKTSSLADFFTPPHRSRAAVGGGAAVVRFDGASQAPPPFITLRLPTPHPLASLQKIIRNGPFCRAIHCLFFFFSLPRPILLT